MTYRSVDLTGSYSPALQRRRTNREENLEVGFPLVIANAALLGGNLYASGLLFNVSVLAAAGTLFGWATAALIISWIAYGIIVPETAMRIQARPFSHNPALGG